MKRTRCSPPITRPAGVKVSYRQASRDDVTRQFRHYLVKLDLPTVAIRFKKAVKKAAQAISEQSGAAPPFRLRNPRLQNLRSWPVG